MTSPLTLNPSLFGAPTVAGSKRPEADCQPEDKVWARQLEQDPTAAFKRAKQMMHEARAALLESAGEVDIRRRDYRVAPGERIDLSEVSPSKAPGVPEDRDLIKLLTERNIKEIDKLQERLYAEHKHKVLFVFQAMDTGGKDGSIEHLCRGMNPAGVTVSSFKSPTAEELDHDPLWRVHSEVPGKGHIGIFNRSHYEDVLYPRVHKMIDTDRAHERMEHMNAFEKMLSDEGTTIVKFFLHISEDEQLSRLKDRQAEPDKNWKLSPADLAERKFWDDYQEAYGDLISRTSTEHAPWYVIPANDKAVRDLILSTIVLKTLKDLEIGMPPAQCDVSKLKIK